MKAKLTAFLLALICYAAPACEAESKGSKPEPYPGVDVYHIECGQKVVNVDERWGKAYTVDMGHTDKPRVVKVWSYRHATPTIEEVLLECSPPTPKKMKR